MGIVDTVGLAAAEQLERTVGPFIALSAYRPLVTRLSAPDLRARAVLGALRCAVRLGDGGEVTSLAQHWSELGRQGEHLDGVIDLCTALFAKGLSSAGVVLARAETQRRPAARSFYLLARCLELAGEASAMQAYGRAAEQADTEPGAQEIALASRAVRIERFAAHPGELGLATAEALAVDPATATPAQKLVIAAARLHAPSRFARASGLSLLEELGRDGGPTAELAIVLAAEHADAFGDALTALEADRLAAVLRHWRDPAERDLALGRLHVLTKIGELQDGEEQDAVIVQAAAADPEIFPLVCRARAVLAGGGQGSYPPPSGQAPPPVAAPLTRLGSLGLDAVVDLQHGRHAEAARALDEARAQVGTAAAIPAPLWTAAYLAVVSRDEAAQGSAAALLEALLGVTRRHPPRGYAFVASLFEQTGRLDVAVRAWRRAAQAKEPEAKDRLGRALIRQGWVLAARGERQAAIEALEEARKHFVREPSARGT